MTEAPEAPEAPEGEEIVWDYASTGLSLRRHPIALLRQRQELLTSRLIGVYGCWQVANDVCNLIADTLLDLTPLLGRLGSQSRDFR
jgi:hypothetical protein